MIHGSYYEPSMLQTFGTGAKINLDRLMELSASSSLNREKIKELGRDGIVDWRTSIPSVSVSLRQKEYGSMTIYQALANSALTTLTQASFKTPATDILGYETDDDAVVLGTVWYPKLRLSGISINIGSPDEQAERSFTLVGEDSLSFYNLNKYIIELTDTVGSGEAGAFDIVIGSGDFSTYPDPVDDPDNSGEYFERIVRVRAGVSYELVAADYSYVSGTTTLTIAAALLDDVYKVIYSATTYISGGDPFVENDSDLAGIEAHSASIYITNTSNYIYRLQNVGIDISLNRQDVKEIGNSEVVSRGVRDTNVSITLGRNLEDYTLEELLRGVSADHGKIDIREFADDLTMIVKFYSDKTKATFKYGWKFTNLSPVGIEDAATVEEYVSKGVSLQGEEFCVSSTEEDIE